jgi:hypothetical protein
MYEIERGWALDKSPPPFVANKGQGRLDPCNVYPPWLRLHPGHFSEDADRAEPQLQGCRMDVLYSVWQPS